MTQELLVNHNLAVIARAELDSQIATAKAYPRNKNECIEYAVSLATMDEATAQSCYYCLPRKDKNGNKVEVRGASIRLAEIVANAWGNLHAATRIVENDGKTITAEGVAHDLEKNVKVSQQSKVSIWFGAKDGKGGYQANADMQTMLANAASAKAFRNAIFKVVPKALIDIVLEKAMTFSIGDVKTVNAKVREVIDKLNKMGLTTESILQYYGYDSIGKITPADYSSLLGVGTAIKEGYIKPEQVFNIEDDEIQGISAAEKVQNLLAEIKPKVDAQTGEIKNNEKVRNSN